MMKIDEIRVPMEASQIMARCLPRESLSQPKIHRPRNVDSRKKAIRASSASGAPKMSPTKRLYSDQVMPNCHLAIVSEPMARNVLRAVVVRTSIVQTSSYAAARGTRVQGHGGALERLLALVGAGSPRLAQRLCGPRLHDRDDRPGPAGEEASPAARPRRQGL